MNIVIFFSVLSTNLRKNQKDLYSQYANIIKTSPAFSSKSFSLLDYGYDFTSDSNEENKREYKTFHSFNLKMLPYMG